MKRLEKRDAEALVLRQIQPGRGLPIQAREPLLVERSGQLDIARAERLRQAREVITVKAADRLAGTDQPRVRRILTLEERERADREVVALVGCQAADADDERPLQVLARLRLPEAAGVEIGRASCRERV